MSIHSKMKYEREMANLTQGDVAKLVGCSTQAISNYENGRVPSEAMLTKITRAIGVSVNTITKDGESMGIARKGGRAREMHMKKVSDACSALNETGEKEEAMNKEEVTEAMDNPSRYVDKRTGIKNKDIVVELPMFMGNAIKYCFRFESKGTPISDLEKAIVCINSDLKREGLIDDLCVNNAVELLDELGDKPLMNLMAFLVAVGQEDNLIKVRGYGMVISVIQSTIDFLKRKEANNV